MGCGDGERYSVKHPCRTLLEVLRPQPPVSARKASRTMEVPVTSQFMTFLKKPLDFEKYFT